MPVLDVSWRVPRSALYEHGGAIAGRMRIPPDGGQEGRQGAACRTDGVAAQMRTATAWASAAGKHEFGGMR
uniref:Uncharacterized protein n=1 Tax=blood disease bacterium R229 TaxID=741978 RepID=G2ZX64_9RALS|nr:hypothetical protein BDB_mp70080 [blood disease bacterium R229]